MNFSIPPELRAGFRKGVQRMDILSLLFFLKGKGGLRISLCSMCLGVYLLLSFEPHD